MYTKMAGSGQNNRSNVLLTTCLCSQHNKKTNGRNSTCVRSRRNILHKPRRTDRRTPQSSLKADFWKFSSLVGELRRTRRTTDGRRGHEGSGGRIRLAVADQCCQICLSQLTKAAHWRRNYVFRRNILIKTTIFARSYLSTQKLKGIGGQVWWWLWLC